MSTDKEILKELRAHNNRYKKVIYGKWPYGVSQNPMYYVSDDGIKPQDPSGVRFCTDMAEAMTYILTNWLGECDGTKTIVAGQVTRYWNKKGYQAIVTWGINNAGLGVYKCTITKNK